MTTELKKPLGVIIHTSFFLNQQWGAEFERYFNSVAYPTMQPLISSIDTPFRDHRRLGIHKEFPGLIPYLRQWLPDGCPPSKRPLPCAEFKRVFL